MLLFVIISLLGVRSNGRAAGDEWRWQTKAGMPWARSAFAACAVDGKVYAIGGFTFSPYVASFNTVAEYDPATDAWTVKADMPTTRTWLSASALNGKIYVIGGMQGPVEQGYPGLRTVEEYDPATDTWTARQDLPEPAGAVSAAQVNGHIYAMGRGTPAGGFVSRVDRYDPQTDTWERVADMPTTRGFLTTAARRGRLYALGGFMAGSVFSVVEEYDPLVDTWIDRGDMHVPSPGGSMLPFQSFGLASAVVGDRIYVMGGARSNLSGDSDLVLAYTPPASDVAFANYMSFRSTGPTTADTLFEQGPFPVEFGLPSPVDPPFPGWDASAVGTTLVGSHDPPTLDEATQILTIPVSDTLTIIARDGIGKELGRIALLGVGIQKLDLNADSAVVDEAAGTIQVRVGGSLLGGQPSATFSAVSWLLMVQIVVCAWNGKVRREFSMPFSSRKTRLRRIGTTSLISKEPAGAW